MGKNAKTLVLMTKNLIAHFTSVSKSVYLMVYKNIEKKVKTTIKLKLFQTMESEKMQRNVILLSASKRELFSLSSGFKSLNRRLRSSWKLVG